MSLFVTPMMFAGFPQGGYRYIRFRSNTAYGTTALGINEIIFRDEGGSDITTGGTPFGTTPTVGTLAGAFNKDTGNTDAPRWVVSGGSEEITVGYDFETLVDISSVDIYWRGSERTDNFFIEGSINLSTWDVLLHSYSSHHITNPTPGALGSFRMVGDVAPQIQTFDSAGTFNVPSDVVFLYMAGAGAGGNASTGGPSGGGGCAAYSNIVDVTPGETLDIDPNDAGAGGDATIRRGGTIIFQVPSASGVNGGNSGDGEFPPGSLENEVRDGGDGTNHINFATGGSCGGPSGAGGSSSTGGHGRSADTDAILQVVTQSTNVEAGASYGGGGGFDAGTAGAGSPGAIWIAWGSYRSPFSGL